MALDLGNPDFCPLFSLKSLWNLFVTVMKKRELISLNNKNKNMQEKKICDAKKKKIVELKIRQWLN